VPHEIQCNADTRKLEEIVYLSTREVETRDREVERQLKDLIAKARKEILTEMYAREVEARDRELKRQFRIQKAQFKDLIAKTRKEILTEVDAREFRRLSSRTDRQGP